MLSLFRANTFFRNFEIKGPPDRLLIYGILFVSECLGKIKSGHGPREAEKVSSKLLWSVRGGVEGERNTFGDWRVGNWGNEELG